METLITAVDNGNFDIKSCIPDGTPKAVRSVKYQIPHGRQALQADNLNPIIEYGGICYHFGWKAFKYRRTEQTVTADKTQEVLLNTLAAIEPVAPEFTVKIRTSHHRAHSEEAAIREALIGSHTYKRNGKPLQVHIDTVEVVPEGYAAWHYAKSLHLIPEQGYTVVIDIGGGTWISRLIDRNGEIIDSTVSERGGAYDLAVNISLDSRLIATLSDQPDPGVIMNGFCEGLHEYGESGISWRGWFDEYLDPWFKNIFGNIKNQYKPYLPQVRRFFVTGGSAHLIRHKIAHAPLFATTDEPRFDNVRGLLIGAVAR